MLSSPFYQWNTANYLSLALIVAPCLIKSLATSPLPKKEAYMSAVFPALTINESIYFVIALTLAPFLINAVTTSKWPFQAEIVRAFLPSLIYKGVKLPKFFIDIILVKRGFFHQRIDNLDIPVFWSNHKSSKSISIQSTFISLLEFRIDIGVAFNKIMGYISVPGYNSRYKSWIPCTLLINSINYIVKAFTRAPFWISDITFSNDLHSHSLMPLVHLIEFIPLLFSILMIYVSNVCTWS